MKTAAATNLRMPAQQNINISGKIASFLGRTVGLLITILICLPVVLLPITTLVPVWILVLLAVADVALIILQFRVLPIWRGMTISLLGVILVSAIAVAASQLFAATPPILGADGQPIPGSIAALEKVNINGGAIALGHPLGCTGCKLTIQNLNDLERLDKKYGMVTACVGGGQGIAGIVERL